MLNKSEKLFFNHNELAEAYMETIIRRGRFLVEKYTLAFQNVISSEFYRPVNIK